MCAIMMNGVSVPALHCGNVLVVLLDLRRQTLALLGWGFSLVSRQLGFECTVLGLQPADLLPQRRCRD